MTTSSYLSITFVPDPVLNIPFFKKEDYVFHAFKKFPASSDICVFWTAGSFAYPYDVCLKLYITMVIWWWKRKIQLYIVAMVVFQTSVFTKGEILKLV